MILISYIKLDGHKCQFSTQLQSSTVTVCCSDTISKLAYEYPLKVCTVGIIYIQTISSTI